MKKSPVICFVAPILCVSLLIPVGCTPKASDSDGDRAGEAGLQIAPESDSAAPEDESPFAPPLNVGTGKDPAAPPSFEAPAGLGGIANDRQGAAPPVIASGLQLPDSASNQQLVSFLGETDREIQRLATTSATPDQQAALVEEIKRVAKLKQAAAERLLTDTQLDSQLTQLAISARMQAFSHQAAFGDLVAAEALEAYAKEMVASPSPEIARDSRTILVGFALERLIGGVTTEPDEVLSLISELASDPQTLNAASAKVMQRAMVMFNQYGYRDAAEKVRVTIEQVFADTTDPKLATLVADILAAARFNELESMRANIYQAGRPGQGAVPQALPMPQEPNAWKQAATKVALESPDLMTVQYLATVALQLEAVGQTKSAEAIYAAIQETVLQNTRGSDPVSDDGASVVASVAGEAISSFDTRQKMLGQPFQIQPQQTLSGKDLGVDQFAGKIVLMPFWAVEQFDSLAPLAGLESMVAAYPEKIQILGVNMDSTQPGIQQAKQLAAFEMPWPSIAAVTATSGSNPFATPIAKAFGVVSLPVVVVLDSQHNVAAIALSPVGVEAAVRSLTQ